MKSMISKFDRGSFRESQPQGQQPFYAQPPPPPQQQPPPPPTPFASPHPPAMAPRFVKKLKSMAKGLAKKIAGELKAAKDQYASGSLRSLIAPGAYYYRNKTSNEAIRRSPTASPAIRPRTRSEEKDEKERARLPRTTPAVRRMTLDD
ncbi:hypothetical protein D6D08_05487 [Aureobasidium pullulans]|nr:hypothetical protein D6D08_05487 [Aureobasidium pullulans]